MSLKSAGIPSLSEIGLFFKQRTYKLRPTNTPDNWEGFVRHWFHILSLWGLIMYVLINIILKYNSPQTLNILVTQSIYQTTLQ